MLTTIGLFTLAVFFTVAYVVIGTLLLYLLSRHLRGFDVYLHRDFILLFWPLWVPLLLMNELSNYIMRRLHEILNT